MDTFERYIGQIFDKRYKIVKIIGIGGMAVVFEAFDTVVKRPVAVKMLKDEISNDTQSVKRFINESKAVSLMSHPNIVSIYDVSFRDDKKYIVMERVEGITLKNYMIKKGALSLRETLEFSEQILLALEHAHSKGIIHRDIKPQNIMLLRDGKIKVADFGIAKLPNAETVTMTDKAIGTVSYISPEQASGRDINPRSDLYSLGVVMYEMATGQLPFVAESPVSVALMQVNDQPRRPRELMPQIPVGLEQIILGAMEKDPERRFQSATQMLRHVEQIKSNPSYIFSNRKQTGKRVRAEAEPDDNMQDAPRRQSRSMLPIIAGITVAFLLVIGLSAAYVISEVLKPYSGDSVKTVTIDNYIGTSFSEELKNSLESTDYYKLEIVYMFSDDYIENVIIAQEPEANSKRKVKAGQQYCDLKLTVSRGEQTVTLPDLTMMEYREAKIELGRLRLVATETKEYSDAVDEGYVCKTLPKAGSTVPAGSTVELFVSRGQNLVKTKVPDFVGKTESVAYRLLVDAKLLLGEVDREYSNTVAKGRIISQSVEKDTEVYENSTKVNFVVSLGPEHPTMPSPVTTPSETTRSPAETTSSPGYWW